MSLEEKVRLLGGSGDGFSIQGNNKYKIPSLVMTDGAVGVVRIHPGTAFPAGIALGATFDPNLSYQMAHAIGEEALSNGENVLLAPNVNIARVPLGGRLYEGYGEDPYLSGQIAASFVRGAQDAHVMTTVKHFILNDQEFLRDSVDVHIDEKTLQEIYLPPFKAAIDAGAVGVMASYNKVRGKYVCEDSYLLNYVLKKQMNFSGFVISDWGATHSTLASALAGLDIEMPNLSYFGEPLIEAVRSNQISEDTINDKVQRILGAMEKVGMLGQAHRTPQKLNWQNHLELARNIAAQSMVLLKNKNHLLPLDPNKKITLALIGPSANVARTGGGGSSYVPSKNAISPLEAIKKQLAIANSPIQVRFSQGTFLAADAQPTNPNLFYTQDENGSLVQGLSGEYFNNAELKNLPTFNRLDKNLEFNWDWSGPSANINSGSFSVRWTAEFRPQQTGEHEFDFSFDDAMRLYINNKLVLDEWKNLDSQGGLRTARYRASFIANKTYSIRIEYSQRSNLATFTASVREPQNGVLSDALLDAVDLAKKADVVVLFVGLSNKLESESFDRTDFNLPQNEIELIQNVSQANPNTIVIVEAGSPVNLSWQDKVRSLIYAWYPGVEGGNAIYDVLFGRVNPSAKLPVTMPVSLEDVPAMNNYPGNENNTESYLEGAHVGYRGIKNAYYPFGFGLSYSDFSINNLKVITKNKKIMITLNLSNLSDLDGQEVVEIYTNNPKTQDYWNLKAFKKVLSNKKSSQEVTFELPLTQTFQEYDLQKKNWTLPQGARKILIKIGSQIKGLEKQITIDNKLNTN